MRSMKWLAALRSQWHLRQRLLGITISHSNESDTDPATREQQIPLHRQRQAQKRQFKKASLFPDGKTNQAALSFVLRGVAEILSQKIDLPWKTEAGGTLSYEKTVPDDKGKICYYVTDNPEQPSEILEPVAALAVIDQFDPRAGAIHLIYCALTANLEQPSAGNFAIDHTQLLEYTGLNKRRDLCRHDQLLILYNLLRQPAQVVAAIALAKGTGVTVADIQIWDIAVLRDYDGDRKLTGLKVIGKPGTWTKYLHSESYRHTGIITKRTVQKLFSIGKQNAGAARLLIWLTFTPDLDCLEGKTLLEIAYGAEKVARSQRDRQLRRQMADDFETDLNVVKEAGWQVELLTGPAWLTNRTKRPIGYWDDLLNTTWRFHLPAEVQEHLIPTPTVNNILPPSSNAIREARKAKGWSRAFLANTMGKSVSWVDAVETGHRQVSPKDLPKLLDTLELHL